MSKFAYFGLFFITFLFISTFVSYQIFDDYNHVFSNFSFVFIKILGCFMRGSVDTLDNHNLLRKMAWSDVKNSEDFLT